MEAEFSLIDVFSDRPFGGNQLAVFPRAEGLSDEVMQQLAREFNFAESTFVLPSSDPACTHRVRIFTPRTELPFAGHATVGTAAVLASRNPGSSQFLFEEGIGPVTVIADGPAPAAGNKTGTRIGTAHRQRHARRCRACAGTVLTAGNAVRE